MSTPPRQLWKTRACTHAGRQVVLCSSPLDPEALDARSAGCASVSLPSAAHPELFASPWAVAALGHVLLQFGPTSDRRPAADGLRSALLVRLIDAPLSLQIDWLASKKRAGTGFKQGQQQQGQLWTPMPQRVELTSAPSDETIQGHASSSTATTTPRRMARTAAAWSDNSEEPIAVDAATAANLLHSSDYQEEEPADERSSLLDHSSKRRRPRRSSPKPAVSKRSRAIEADAQKHHGSQIRYET